MASAAKLLHIFYFTNSINSSRGCPAQFQVSVDENDKESSKQRSERDSREDGGRLEESEESGDDHDQEIISPASYDLHYQVHS